MSGKLLKIRIEGISASTTLTVITHSLLPLMLFPFAFFVTPPFEEKSSQLFVEPSKLTLFIFGLSSFIRNYWYFCLLILGFALAVDASVYVLLFHSKKKVAASFWSALVILIEAVFAGLFVTMLLLLLHNLSTVPWLCPI